MFRTHKQQQQQPNRHHNQIINNKPTKLSTTTTSTRTLLTTTAPFTKKQYRPSISKPYPLTRSIHPSKQKTSKFDTRLAMDPTQPPTTAQVRDMSPPRIGSFRRYDSSQIFGNPTYKMSTQDRCQFNRDCDLRSIQHGISLIFGDWDQDLIVINKPFGVPMEASHRDSVGGRLRSILGHTSIFPVHRLDKYTSGCLVVALKADVARVLQYSLQNHTLASIKTTKNNVNQKIKLGHIKQTMGVDENGNPIQVLQDQDEIAEASAQLKAGQRLGKNGTIQNISPPVKVRANDADVAWSKRYRVMVQLTPCLQRDLKSFMSEQWDAAAKLDPKLPALNYNSDLHDDYLRLIGQYNNGIVGGKDNDGMGQIPISQVLSTTASSSSSSSSFFHSPDIIRSPHQEGTLYTPIYSVQHRRDEHQQLPLLPHKANETPPPLLSHGYLHSHLTHRDFFPADWVHMNDVIHVDHLNANLERRLIDTAAVLHHQQEHQQDQQQESNQPIITPPQLNYTNVVGITNIEDSRVPQGHAHGSALFLEPPPNTQTSNTSPKLIKVDLSSTPTTVPTDNINNTLKHPQIISSLNTLLDKHQTQSLRNLRDAVEYRLLVPGAPRPPDNEDDDPDEEEAQTKTNVFSIDGLQAAIAALKTTDLSQLSLPQRKELIYNFFTRLCAAEGMAIAPFYWINAKIQLFEKVVKMHVLGKLYSKQQKISFRRSDNFDLYAPDFALAAAGPTMMNTVGKLLVHDTTDTKTALNHNRPDGVHPLDQNGNVIHTHTSDVYFADRDMMFSPKTITSRQHPFFWTSHRVMLKHNTTEESHPLQSFMDWSKIDKYGNLTKFNHDDHNRSEQRPTPPPALQPFELPCGCLLPYSTPLPKHVAAEYEQKPSLYKNPHSIIPILPPSAPHPFIPTNYLYESVPAGTFRDKFTPQRNIMSLPQNIPPDLFKEFDQKEAELEANEAENQRKQLELDHKVANAETGSGASPDLVELNKGLKSKSKQKRDRNNARVVSFDGSKHDNHTTGTFGSILTSTPFDPNNGQITPYNDPNYAPESNPAWTQPISKRQILRNQTQAPGHVTPPPARIPTTATATKQTNTNLTSGSENIMISVPDTESKEATTLFRMHYLNIDKGICIYNAKLLSGRTHQLRIHFSDAGLPIRGDPYYNPYYIKTWANQSLYAYYNRQHFNQYLRSIHILPLFGLCDAGVTAQMCSADVWDAIINPNAMVGQGKLQPSSSSTQTDGNDTINKLKSDLLLTVTPYTKTVQSLPDLTRIFDFVGDNEHNLGQFVPNTSTALFNNALSSSSSSSTTTSSTPLGGDNTEERSFTNEEIDHYLDIYKAFSKANIDGEMFLQSYLIEFPLPTEIRPPTRLKQISNQKVRSEELREKYLASLMNEGFDVSDKTNVNAREDSPERVEKDAEIAKVLSQTTRDAFAPRVTLLNPTLTDGLPLYHNRMSPEEVKSEREKRKANKKLQIQKKKAINQLVDTSDTSALEKDNDGAYVGSGQCGGELVQTPTTTTATTTTTTTAAAMVFSDTVSSQPEHTASAEQFVASPDDLDKYCIHYDPNEDIIIDQDGNEISSPAPLNTPPPHPDGFTEITPLFSSQLNPVWSAVHAFAQTDEVTSKYNPAKQLTTATVQPGGDNFQTDSTVTLTYDGKQVSTPLSHILHLQTQHKSWTYKTSEGTQMVRILLGLPDSWKYAM